MRIEPVYGLTTMHSSLRAFLAESVLDPFAKAASHAFGLIALGKFILRLPTEVLEEELPRLKQTFISVSSTLSYGRSLAHNFPGIKRYVDSCCPRGCICRHHCCTISSAGRSTLVRAP